MRPDVVVVSSGLGRSSARLEDRREHMHVEQLVPDLSIQRLDLRVPLVGLRVFSVISRIRGGRRLPAARRLPGPTGATMRQLPALLGHGWIGIAAFAAIAASLVVFTPVFWWAITMIPTFFELSGELWDGVIDSGARKKLGVSFPKIAISAKAAIFLGLFWVVANRRSTVRPSHVATVRPSANRLPRTNRRPCASCRPAARARRCRLPSCSRPHSQKRLES
jgi:hypothetical protein